MKTDIKTLKKNFERVLELIGRKFEGDSPAKNYEWQNYIKHLRDTSKITEQKFLKIRYEFYPVGMPKPKEFSELSEKEQKEIQELRNRFTNKKEENE